jgi:hypothetical protein
VHPAGQPPVHLHRGNANLELAVPIEETTAFNVGSVGKQITAHLVMHTARQGLLSLDQPAARFLPRFRIPDVTVAELLLHHGGVRDTESLLSLAGFRDLDHYTANDLVELAYRQSNRAVPPGRFLYSNTGYLPLAEIMRSVHGTDLGELARHMVFTPLGMTSAHFRTDPSQVIPGAASSYSTTHSGWKHCARPVTLPGPGSLWCTATDLDRWLSHVHSEWAEKPQTLPLANDLPYQLSDHEPYLYGPGLYADPRPAHTAVFHYGHEQGFSAATHLTEQGLRVISLSNHADMAADQIAATVLTALHHDPGQDLDSLLVHTADVHQLVAPAVQPPAPDTDSNDEDPHTMLGTYTCDQVPGTLRLSCQNGALYVWRRGTRDRLTPTGSPTYKADGYTLTLQGPLGARPGAFVLDLERAPGLLYRPA